MDRSSLAVGRSTFLVIYIRTVLVHLFNLQDFEEMIIRDKFNLIRGLNFNGGGSYYYSYSHKWGDYTGHHSYEMCTTMILKEIKRR